MSAFGWTPSGPVSLSSTSRGSCSGAHLIGHSWVRFSDGSRTDSISSMRSTSSGSSIGASRRRGCGFTAKPETEGEDYEAVFSS